MFQIAMLLLFLFFYFIYSFIFSIEKILWGLNILSAVPTCPQ